MADVTFTYDIGYMGVVKLDSVPLLATGGNLNIQQQPIFTTGVWGAGWYTAAQQIAYAPNYITTSGSVNFQLTGPVQGSNQSAFNKIQDFAFQKRNEGKQFEILPNGIAGYAGKGWCQSCSFNASQDAIITGDIGFKTGNVQNCINTTSITDDDAKLGSNVNLNDAFGTSYLNVFPFWASGVCLMKSGNSDRPAENVALTWGDNNKRDDIIDWNASYSSELALVATCANYSSLDDSKQAKYCALGTMNADGSFTIFRVAGDLDPDQIRQCRKCTIEMGTAAAPAKKAKIIFGSIVFSSGSTDIQTGSSIIQSSFNFTALGNGRNPIMSLKEPTA